MLETSEPPYRARKPGPRELAAAIDVQSPPARAGER
jgi:hypothetical protein